MVWYDESTRCPAIVRWPGRVKPGTKVGALTSGVDLLPTLLEAAGAPPLPKAAGLSMIPVLTGGKPGRSVVFSEGKAQTTLGANSYWQMAKSADWKYVRFNDGREIFYDLRKDPWEKTDSVKDPAALSGLTAARKALDDWIRQTS
jgi:choline-sulfatase